ncbi:uncharacterized protein LOC134841705 [Symsagittifera roscoffensis]|uniref:uncharacterized protein LOC134841705 n=1 Tax=Symsagittifera roscoffensis TaxID=84072 RepID=UPI00307B5E97
MVKLRSPALQRSQQVFKFVAQFTLVVSLVTQWCVLWPVALCSQPFPLSISWASSDWESLVFWLSYDIGRLEIACRTHSHYYCLDLYRTQNPYLNDTENLSQPAYDIQAVRAWFGILIQDQWHRINMVDFENPGYCCVSQTMKYLVHGLHNKRWDPEQYMAKLIDYDDENKPLNFIMAIKSPLSSCENIIVKVGFGPGNLRRSHGDSVIPGAPYTIAGRQLQPIGIPHIDSVHFDFFDPGQELTFHWFKHNIMCKDNAWICEKEVTPKKEKKPKNEGSGSGSSGNKKSQRKKQTKAEKQNRVKQS